MRQQNPDAQHRSGDQGFRHARPDGVYEFAWQHFSGKELLDLTMAIVAINGWNRLTISSRKVPGTYQPRHQEKEVTGER